MGVLTYRHIGAVMIDSQQPLDTVVDEIIVTISSPSPLDRLQAV